MWTDDGGVQKALASCLTPEWPQKSNPRATMVDRKLWSQDASNTEKMLSQIRKPGLGLFSKSYLLLKISGTNERASSWELKPAR